MATLGKKAWGGKGKSFDATEQVEALLEKKVGKRAETIYSNYLSRHYDRVLEVDGTKVKFSYCSALPGYGTIRWRGKNDTIKAAVLEVARGLCVNLNL